MKQKLLIALCVVTLVSTLTLSTACSNRSEDPMLGTWQFYGVMESGNLSDYEAVKENVGSKDVAPEDLIREINRRIHRINLESARDLEDKPSVSEDYENKITRVNDPYRGSNSVNVYGNEDYDVAIVSDSRSKDDHEVVTFDRDEYGDTIIESHRQDIEGKDTVKKGIQEEVIDSDNSLTDNKDEDVMVEEEKEEDLLPLISTEEFYNLLKANRELNAEEK